MKKTLVTVSILVIALFLMWSANSRTSPKKDVASFSFHAERDHSIQTKDYATEAVIGGIGDILIHDTVYEDAKTEQGYDFTSMFSPVKPTLQKPDLLIANQESVPGGESLGISTYPTFNSPYQIVDALMDSGVDMVTAANNHSLDKGQEGILKAISYYESKNLPYTGMYKSPEDKADMRIVDVNGIKFAILAYAEHFNGIPVPAEKEYLVSPLEKDAILADIAKAESKADVVVLAVHWGDEYVREPNNNQKKLAQEFIYNGADIILGHHPHVLQPMEMIKQKDGGEGLVVYSLGNFLSGQIWDFKDIGGMVEILVEKRVTGSQVHVSLKDIEFHPTFTASKGFRNYQIYPLDEANAKGFTNESKASIRQFMQIP
ncbi:CapA family protein [Siminovitchia sediminis]|uniref:CapA family protein n=1 Tax=Siminovitchia sediminis TaxID=1274353 RepID=A0ABW4KGI4_9BACI